MRLDVPTPSLVLLVGPTSSGKSTFAACHFAPTEVVSSDHYRAVVGDDPNDQAATDDAFAVLHLVVARRLARMRLTVVDATNLQASARAPLVALARRAHLPVVAIVFDLPVAECETRQASRVDRDASAAALVRQHARLAGIVEVLRAEGVRAVAQFTDVAEVDAATVVRAPLPPDRRGERGPFDVVGDVHGCIDELEALLARLGYGPNGSGPDAAWTHPDGRRLVFLGDFVDRGPEPVRVLRLAMACVAAGSALAVPGNHDDKLRRALAGRDVHTAHGLGVTLAAVRGEGDDFARRVHDFLDALPSHLVLDGGALVAAHGGMPERLQGRDDKTVRARALFGETTGLLDTDGLPTRIDWAAAYRGGAFVAYGHTPVLAPRWCHDTVDLDTGCAYGGALSALRWPEREVVSEPARRAYAVPSRPILADPFVSRAAAGASDQRGAERRSEERRGA